MAVNIQYYCETCSQWFINTNFESHINANPTHVLVEKLRHVLAGEELVEVDNDTVDPPAPLNAGRAINRIYDAIVDAAGTGDYLLPSEAFNAGHQKVFIMPGDYTEISTIFIPDEGALISTPLGTATISLISTVSIEADAGPGIEDTGTVSITNGTNTVSGTGTSFTNLSTGDYIILVARSYEIANISNDTSLTLTETYYGNTLTNSNQWYARAMFTGITLSNFTVKGDGGNAIFLRGCRKSVLDDIIVDEAVDDNIQLTRCDGVTVRNVFTCNSESSGLTMNNCRNISFKNCFFENNAVEGLDFNGINRHVTIGGCTFANNAANGMSLGGDTDNVTITNSIFTNNLGKGLVTLGSNVFECTIENCVLTENGDAGMDFDARGAIITGCVVKSNGSHGIQGGIRGLISNNQLLQNDGNGLILTNADDRAIVTGNMCGNNTANGIRVASDYVIVSNNDCFSNDINGIFIVSGATDCIVIGNHCLNNTNSNINDSGTNTIVAHNVGIFDGPSVRFQVSKTSNAQNINLVAATAITWNATQFTNSDFSYTSGSSNITVNTTGLYKISFSISSSGLLALTNCRVGVYINGTINLNTAVYDISQNSLDSRTTHTLPPFEIALNASDVISIRGIGLGSLNTLTTNLNECWLRIERTN